MPKTWQCELKRTRGASRLGFRLKNIYLQSLLSEYDRRCEAIGARSDNARFAGHLRSSLRCELIGA